MSEFIDEPKDAENADEDVDVVDEGGDHVIDEEGNPIIEKGGENEEAENISYLDTLDATRDLPDPITLTFDHLKQIVYELGLIKLCWPDVIQHIFEDRSNFPIRYLKNNEKEKTVLLYAENFRQQFCDKYPTRNPLVLACDNECDIQKMVCTTIRPTTLPYPELETLQDCAKFVADHLKFEPFDEFPTLLAILIRHWWFRTVSHGVRDMVAKPSGDSEALTVTRHDEMSFLPSQNFGRKFEGRVAEAVSDLFCHGCGSPANRTGFDVDNNNNNSQLYL